MTNLESHRVISARDEPQISSWGPALCSFRDLHSDHESLPVLSTFRPQTTLETCNLLDLKSGFQNEAFSRTKIFARTSQVILHFDMHDLI